MITMITIIDSNNKDSRKSIGNRNGNSILVTFTITSISAIRHRARIMTMIRMMVMTRTTVVRVTAITIVLVEMSVMATLIFLQS